MAADSKPPAGDHMNGYCSSVASPVALLSKVPEELVLLRRLSKLPAEAACRLLGISLLVISDLMTPETAYRSFKRGAGLRPAPSKRRPRQSG